MSDTAAANPVLDAVKALQADVNKQGEQIAALEKRVSEKPASASILAPAVRKGEDPMSSRGYSFLKMIGLVAGQVSSEDAKVEADIHNRLQKSLVEGTPYKKSATNSIMAPFSSAHMLCDEGALSKNLISEVRDLVLAGVSGYDYDEVVHLRKQLRSKALSWIDQSAGGALVGPPVMGELIEIFRNNEALMAAGARDIGMPASGRATWPRHTGTATAYWVGESTTITDSTQATGDLVLTAKKLGVLCKLPNELFRFATIAAEAFVREDIAKSMALELDNQLLEGTGSALKPKGLITYSGIVSHTAATTGVDGDTFEPEDVGDMISKVEERNAEFTAFIMRPRMYSKLRNRRADAVSAGDKKGPFLFDFDRSVTEDMNRGRGMGVLEGKKVVKSTQVSQARTKGAGTDLTYILGGNFADFMIALSGVIEFLVANAGDTMVEKDQTWVRGIQLVDGAPRHESSFVLCDTLVVA